MKEQRQVATGLARAGFVPQTDATHSELGEALGLHSCIPGIVIAGDPDPVGRAHQRIEHAGGVGFEPGGAVAVVEIVAEAEDAARTGCAKGIRDSGQCLSAVVGRQHLAALGIPARFFEVQIGNDQRALFRPVQRARRGEREFLPGESEGGAKRCERNRNHAQALPDCVWLGKTCPMSTASEAVTAVAKEDWSAETARARTWFESLRDRICAEFEAIEREAGSDASFTYTPWKREHHGEPQSDSNGPDGGGGVQGLMKGKVFEKVGVNVSTVGGTFSADFARTMNGADPDNPAFTATGISLVAHMANPHVPAVHMNTRFLTTRKAWFGGGGDLNPPIPYAEDTADFHARYNAACDKHDPAYYDKFKAWADDYFYIPHRKVHRGVGGIFYDHLECADEAGFEANFAFTRDVGDAFLNVYPALVRRRMNMDWTPDDKLKQLAWRGRYAEFNLVYDRGTLFGLKTGGNIDAILMSLPPEANWV